MTARRLFVAAVTASAVLWAACAPPTGGNSPVVIGDSIVMGAQLHGFMNRMPNAFTDADPGRGIYSKGMSTGRNGVETAPLALTRLAPGHGSWVVIELGTNGLEQDDPAWYRPNIVDMLNTIPADRCVAWVTVWNGRTSYTRALSVAFNDVLRDELQHWRSCYRVIEWADTVQFNIGLLDNVNGRPTDWVHPNGYGEAELARLIDEAT